MKKALIMEDNPHHAYIIQRFLVDMLFLCVVCENTFRGIDIAREGQMTVIVTDLKMPLMTGIEFVKEVRKFDATTPIVVITAYAEYKKVAMKAGADYFIAKPIMLEEIKTLFSKFN